MVLFALTYSHEHGIETYLFLSAGCPDCYDIAQKLGLEIEPGEDIMVSVVSNVKTDHQDHALLAELGIPTL